MNQNPYFSIIVPVYNVEAYLKEAVDSLKSQTFQDIEILLVDDGSTDSSKDICMNAAEGEKRIRVISHDRNKSLYQARKTGVENAKGKYILFLDGDDVLDPEATACIYSELKSSPADILQFDIEVSGLEHWDFAVNALETVYTPWQGELIGENLIDDCFKENKFCWSMAGKAYEAGLMRKSYAFMTDAQMNMCEDIYQTFVILYFARVYRGIPIKLYTYYYGRGMSASDSGRRDSFERVCKTKAIPESITGFLEENGAVKKFEDAVDCIDSFITHTIINSWLKLPGSGRAGTIKDMTEILDAEEIVTALAEMYDGANAGAKQAHDYRAAYTDMKESESYNVGLKVTAPARALKKAILGKKNDKG